MLPSRLGLAGQRNHVEQVHQLGGHGEGQGLGSADSGGSCSEWSLSWPRRMPMDGDEPARGSDELAGDGAAK
jgi:hypothetical protein